jgi:hypothetical protein
MDPGLRPLLPEEKARNVLETESLAMKLLLPIGKGLNIGATQNLALRHTDAGRYPSTIRKEQRWTPAYAGVTRMRSHVASTFPGQ